jgi:hypothetical protein
MIIHLHTYEIFNRFLKPNLIKRESTEIILILLLYT